MSAAPITVVLDGRPRELPPGTTLAELVEQLGHSPETVATAVNGRFAPRGLRGARVLQSGDAVLLFQPLVGG